MNNVKNCKQIVHGRFDNLRKNVMDLINQREKMLMKEIDGISMRTETTVQRRLQQLKTQQDNANNLVGEWLDEKREYTRYCHYDLKGLMNALPEKAMNVPVDFIVDINDEFLSEFMVVSEHYPLPR
eukprot:116529_1